MINVWKRSHLTIKVPLVCDKMIISATKYSRIYKTLMEQIWEKLS